MLHAKCAICTKGNKGLDKFNGELVYQECADNYKTGESEVSDDE